MTQRGGIVLAIMVLAGCVAPSPSPLLTAPLAPSPALGQWPPLGIGDAPGVELRVRDKDLVLTNRSATTYWLVPPVPSVWEGGSPWLTRAEPTPPPGSLRLAPDSSLTFPVPRTERTIRIGVQLWTEPEPDTLRTEPWFEWVELEGA